MAFLRSLALPPLSPLPEVTKKTKGLGEKNCCPLPSAVKYKSVPTKQAHQFIEKYQEPAASLWKDFLRTQSQRPNQHKMAKIVLAVIAAVASFMLGKVIQSVLCIG